MAWPTASQSAVTVLSALPLRTAFSFDVAPRTYPVLSSFLALVLKRYPFLGQAELENSGLRPHPGGAAGRPFMNTIGDLLPIALCGLTSL